MKKNNKKDFDNKNLIGNTDNVESQNDLSNGFDDLMYDSLDGDYQYFDGNEFDEVEEKAEKSASEEYLIAETQENIILPEVEGAEIALVEDNRPIKVREIAVQSDTTKVNAFDLFFLRLWAGMVSLLGYTANGINYIFYKIFKHKLPVKYIKAFLVALVIILLLIMILVPATANSQPKSKGDGGLVVFESNMIPVQVRVDDGSGDPVYKWGYLEKKKASTGTKDSLKIPAIYEEALPFNRYDIAWVRVRDEKGHYWQLINKNGKRVGDRMYAVSNSLPIGVRPFGEFTDSKLAWVNENGKFGYIDIKGNVKINCDLDVAGDFIEGIARVGRGAYQWFIDKKGNIIGRARDYVAVLDFSCGLGAVNQGGRWGFINKKGKEVIELKYDAVSRFVDGYAMVKMGKTFGLIDTDGNLVINTQWFYDIVINNSVFEEFIENHK